MTYLRHNQVFGNQDSAQMLHIHHYLFISEVIRDCFLILVYLDCQLTN